ncbi:MAG: hypothetical protein ACE5EX_02525, partial [Phycisphaerae bacterium]
KPAGFTAMPGVAGSRVLTLHRKGDRTEVTEVWANRKMGVGQNNVVRVGDHLYGCSGGDSSSFMTAIDAKTGKIAWKERGFAKTNLLHADGKFILLDEDGTLSLATATPKAIKVVSKVSLLKKKAWTVPTLVGHTLFVRDKKRIMALNLGADAS